MATHSTGPTQHTSEAVGLLKELQSAFFVPPFPVRAGVLSMSTLSLAR